MILYTNGTYVTEGEQIGLSTTFEELPTPPDVKEEAGVFNLNIK